MVVLTMMLTSCIKGEPQNMECDILEAWVEGDNLAQHFSQETDMRIIDVPSSIELLTFTVRQRALLPSVPTASLPLCSMICDWVEALMRYCKSSACHSLTQRI